MIATVRSRSKPLNPINKFFRFMIRLVVWRDRFTDAALPRKHCRCTGVAPANHGSATAWRRPAHPLIPIRNPVSMSTIPESRNPFTTMSFSVFLSLVFLPFAAVADAGAASRESARKAVQAAAGWVTLAQLTANEREDLRADLRQRAREWAAREASQDRPMDGLRVLDDGGGNPSTGLTDRERRVLREQLRRMHTEPRPVPSMNRVSGPVSGDRVNPMSVRIVAPGAVVNNVAIETEERVPAGNR